MTTSTTDVRNIAALDVPKATQDIFTLPCGYLAPDGTLHTEVHLREMRGSEQDLLASKKMGGIQKLNELLFRCTLRIGTISDRNLLPAIVKELTVGDRVYMLMMIRVVTLGEKYSYDSVCPECEKKSTFDVSLMDFEKKAMPDPKRRIYDMTLPSGAKIRYHVSTGLDEVEIDKIKDNDDDKPSKQIMMRLELLNGQPPTLEDVKSMKWEDRFHLTEFWGDVEGGVDTSLDTECPHCGHEYKEELSLGKDFFFPSASRRKR